ncbi:AAA family ATPase [Microbacterium lacticum]
MLQRAYHTARLLGVSWIPVDRGKDRNTGWEIDGVPAELIAEFSRRTTGSGGVDGIDATKNRLIAEYVAAHGREPSAAAVAGLRQQATLETRPEKELHSLADLTKEWRERATTLLGEDATTWAQHLLALGLSEARLRADDVALDQVADIATVVLMEVANRRSVWNRWNIHAETMRQLMGVRFVSTADRTAVLDQIIEHAETESLRLTPEYDRALPAHFIDDSGPRFQSFDQIAYSSQDILNAEHRLLALSQNTDGPTLSARLVARHISRKIKGVRLDPDQVAAITQLARSGRVLDLLVGPAGAGKTTALRALHRAWTAAHGRDSVIGLAPSAAAAEVLGDSLGITAENTAKFLFEHQKGRWDLRPGQLILLDEASLAGTLALDHISALAAEAGAKIVLVGDWGQLSSVESGGAFGMLVRDRGTAPALTAVRRLVAAGKVEAGGVVLHDGTSAGTGDLVVTRRNERRLTTGHAWVKNGDRWQVTRRFDDGSLAVRRLGKGDRARGKVLVLPAVYVREDVELGYASTVHRAQGANVDSGHALVDPDTASRELLYVAMTRGKERNDAYVIQPDPHEAEPHLEPPEEKSGIEQVTRVLARSDADLSATETLAAEADKHAALATLLDEYDVLARDAQSARWEAFLDVAPFPDGVADDIFTSPFYDQLESALTRHEATGRTPTVALNALAPRLTPNDEETDPAAQLAAWLDEATSQLPRRRDSRTRVAGLIPLPAEPLAEDMRRSPSDRKVLIEAGTYRLVTEAQQAGAAWLDSLDAPGPHPRRHARWQAEAATIALYRYRYDIHSRSPLGAPSGPTNAAQDAERRIAVSALQRIRGLRRRSDAIASAVNPGPSSPPARELS